MTSWPNGEERLVSSCARAPDITGTTLLAGPGGGHYRQWHRAVDQIHPGVAVPYDGAGSGQVNGVVSMVPGGRASVSRPSGA